MQLLLTKGKKKSDDTSRVFLLKNASMRFLFMALSVNHTTARKAKPKIKR